MTESTEQIYCVIDYETFSEADLKRCGGWEYSVHPSTEIICVAWRIGTKDTLEYEDTKTWSPHRPGPYGELIRALCNPNVKLVAHNSLFEQVITKNVLSRIINRSELKSIPVSRWTCTAALAASLALPRSLEGACSALNLDAKKDTEGRKLILKWCKPRKPTKNNPSTRHEDPAELDRLIQYCANDIEAEVGLFLKLPDLTPLERKVWELDQNINLNGFRVDRPLVKKILGMIGEETERLNQETIEMTGILSANQRGEVLKFLESEGIVLENLQKKTVSDAVAGRVADGKAHRLLEIRQAISKTSTAKYEAFEQRSRFDGRCRDILLYCGAGTGRWTGLGVQPQNLTRSTIKDTDTAAQNTLDGDIEWIRMLYGEPMSVFSSLVRSVIIASPGNELVCADYATIEVRVLFWLAGHEQGLEMFRSGQDIYRHMAAEIYSRPLDEIKNPSNERQLGKTAILGLGYGMGPKKFVATCENQGIAASEELAKRAVKIYRSTHSPVVSLWYNIERAAIRAVKSHREGKPVKVKTNLTSWWVKDDFLWCELPGGRRLAYHRPEIKYEETPWGEPQAKLYFWAQNNLTRQWERTATYGGSLVENVIQAAARDLMAEAMLRCSEQGYQIVLSVHDELIAEQRKGKWPVERFENLMSELPVWAHGCPVSAKGWVGARYRK